jgi:predicted membrane protein
VRAGTALALLGSVAGALLSFYLTGLGSYTLMEPLRLLAFSILWTLPVFLLDNLAGRY